MHIFLFDNQIITLADANMIALIKSSRIKDNKGTIFIFFRLLISNNLVSGQNLNGDYIARTPLTPNVYFANTAINIFACKLLLGNGLCQLFKCVFKS